MCHVLIVDDDAQVRSMLVEALPRAIGASSIEEGLAVAKGHQPSWILLDNRFQDVWLTGLDALPRFRALAPKAKIVLMTAAPNRYEEEQARRAGAEDYCCKALDLAEKLKAVASLPPRVAA